MLVPADVVLIAAEDSTLNDLVVGDVHRYVVFIVGRWDISRKIVILFWSQPAPNPHTTDAPDTPDSNKDPTIRDNFDNTLIPQYLLDPQGYLITIMTQQDLHIESLLILDAVTMETPMV